MRKCELVTGRKNFIHDCFKMGFWVEEGIGSFSLDLECVYI